MADLTLAFSHGTIPALSCAPPQGARAQNRMADKIAKLQRERIGYSPIDRRRRLQWPNGTRVALWLLPTKPSRMVSAGSGGQS
jgi:hypothetical protein